MKTTNKFLKITGSLVCLCLAIVTTSCSTDDVSTTDEGLSTTNTTAAVDSNKVLNSFKIQIGIVADNVDSTDYFTMNSTKVTPYCYISGNDVVLTMNKGKSTRSELRGTAEYNHNTEAYLQTKSYITKNLGSSELCVAQLHRKGDNDQPFFMLVVVNGKFRYKQNSHKTDTGNTEDKFYLDGSITYSSSHQYKTTLQMNSGKLYFSIYDYTDKKSYNKTFTISSTNFGSSGYYFKTGVYNQGTGTSELKINTLYTGTGTAPLVAY
jgi:hypothetical protein